jgi:hypothetical protein
MQADIAITSLAVFMVLMGMIFMFSAMQLENSKTLFEIAAYRILMLIGVLLTGGGVAILFLYALGYSIL